MASTFGRITTRVAVSTGVLLAAGAIAATSASAATLTYTVAAGSSTSGTAKVTGKTTDIGGTQQIMFTDTSTHQDLGCVSGAAKGAAKLGTAVAATDVGTIASTTWNSCSGPAGIMLAPKQNSTWNIVATGKTKSGKTPASVTNVDATVTGTGCSFDVKGAATGSYDNASGNLALVPVAKPTKTQKLTVSGVNGCFGAINNGDNVTFTATYKLVSKPAGLTVTSN